MRAYALSYVSDGLRIPTSPLRWKGSEWLTAGATVATAGMAYLYDDELRSFFQKNKSESLTALSFAAEPFGNVFVGFGSMALIGLAGAATGHENACRLGLTGVKAFVLSTATAQVSKSLFGRQRPDEGMAPDPAKWHGPGLRTNYKSFYSNHASNAFALAAVVSGFYDNRPGIAIPAYTVAALTALSRVYDDKHWSSDVIIGAAIGYGIGQLVVNSSKWKLKVEPAYDPATQTAGLSIHYSIP